MAPTDVDFSFSECKRICRGRHGHEGIDKAAADCKLISAALHNRGLVCPQKQDLPHSSA